MLKETQKTETMILNMGPQHPSTHGVLRVVLELDGEVIVNATPHIGYLHRGLEKLAENRTYHQVITLTDRMDYLGPMINNLGYVLAVEKMLDIKATKRAEVIRVMLSELTRIQSHLVWMGTHAHDMGAMTPVLYAFREREKIMDLFEMVCGARMNPSYFRVGGLAYDLPEGFISEVEEFLEMMPSRVDVYEALLTKNKIWMIRTKGVGVISDDEAVNLGLSGPALRACGANWDIRKAEPYSGYENFNFEIAKGENGDVYDRYLVRIKEMRESLKITAQAIRDLPEGPINVEDPKVVLPPKDKVHNSIDGLIRHFHIISEGFNVPAGEVYLSVESPRGELGYYIVSDGGTRPYRLKIRAPSYINLESLCTMVKGRMISDVIAVIGSLDIVLGEIDR